MPIRKMLLMLLSLLLTSYVVAQESGTSKLGDNSQSNSQFNLQPHLPSIGAQIGIFSFVGDVSADRKDAGLYSNATLGYGGYIEEKFGPVLGLHLNFTSGSLSKSYIDTATFRNFNSKIMSIDLSLIFDFDNNYIIHSQSKFAPFLSVGFGYLKFDPYGDLKDANGNPYYHWDNGQLYDEPQTDSTLFSAKIVNRDYKYETELDSTNKYTHSTFYVPIKLGVKFKLAEHIDCRVYASYNLTFSDYLDNIKANGNNDKYVYSAFTMQYNFGSGDRTARLRRNAVDTRYKDVNFKKMNSSDQDHDGVPDVRDQCPNTPAGVKVDSHGCPKSAAKTAQAVPDSTSNDDDKIAVQKNSFSSDKSEEKNTLVLSHSKIPAQYRALDRDHNGYISAQEVTQAISDFFDGKNNLTPKSLNGLVSFFFEQ